MEPLQHLSNESFSYSWLINIKPFTDPLDDSGRRHSLDTQDGSSYIEMDPDFISMRWTSDGRDFDFTLPSSKASVFVHADDIFSNGLILPLHLMASPESSDSVLSRTLSPGLSKNLISQSKHFSMSTPSRNQKLVKLPFFRNCVRSPKKMLRKYFFFLLSPLYKKVKGLRLGSTKSARSGGRVSSSATSPRTSNGFSSIGCRGSTIFDVAAENSIYDAVLHCKRSIGQH